MAKGSGDGVAGSPADPGGPQGADATEESSALSSNPRHSVSQTSQCCVAGIEVCHLATRCPFRWAWTAPPSAACGGSSFIALGSGPALLPLRVPSLCWHTAWFFRPARGPTEVDVKWQHIGTEWEEPGATEAHPLFSGGHGSAQAQVL